MAALAPADTDAVLSFQPMARIYARRAAARFVRLEYPDLFQTAMLGVVEAVATFDAARNVLLKTYVENKVRWSIAESIRQAAGRMQKETELLNEEGELFVDFADVSENAFDALLRKERKAREALVRPALRLLPKEDLAVLRMLLLCGNPRSTAAALNMSRASIYKIRQNIVRRLRVILSHV